MARLEVGGLLDRLVVSVTSLFISRLELLLLSLEVAVPDERALRVARQLLIVIVVSLVFSWSADPLNPVCSVPSVEVLLSVAVVALVHISCVPPALLREEV